MDEKLQLMNGIWQYFFGYTPTGLLDIDIFYLPHSPHSDIRSANLRYDICKSLQNKD